MMQKRLILIALYMALIFCVILAEIHYAREHPLVDERSETGRKDK